MEGEKQREGYDSAGKYGEKKREEIKIDRNREKGMKTIRQRTRKKEGWRKSIFMTQGECNLGKVRKTNTARLRDIKKTACFLLFVCLLF